MGAATLSRVPAGKSEVTVEGSLSALYKRTKTPVDDRTVSSLFALALPAAGENAQATAAVASLNEDIKRISAERDAAEERRQKTDVLVSRIVYLLTTDEVRGVRTMTQVQAAEHLHITKQRVNQYVVTGRGLWLALGEPSSKGITGNETAAYKVIERARRDGGSTLPNVIETLKADVKADGGKPSASRLSTAYATVTGAAKAAAKTEPTVVKVKTEHAAIERALTAMSGADRVEGTRDETDALLGALQRMAAWVTDHVTIVDPPAPKVTGAEKKAAKAAQDAARDAAHIAEMSGPASE